MSNVKTVLIHLGPGRVAEGFYVVEDGLLIMTFDDGSPVILDDGSKVTHTIREGDNIRAIAAVLTGEVRRALMNELVPGFARHLDYPCAGVA